jgi:hypothetical protein
MFASPSQIEAITAEKCSNSVVSLSLGMWQKNTIAKLADS